MDNRIQRIIEDRKFKPNLPAFTTGQFKNGIFIYYYYDLYIGSSLLLYGEWAQLEIDFLCQFLDPGDTAVDIGAFIGTHTLPFAREVGITGTVYAFEPTLESFYCLAGNIAMNNMYKVKAFNSALGSRRQQLEFPEMDVAQINNFGAAGCVASIEYKHTGATRAINTTTLDSFKLKNCKLLKIDAEHMELDVLKGAERTIKRCIPFIYAETSPPIFFDEQQKKYTQFNDDTLELVEFMRKFDYAAYYVISSVYNPDNFFLNTNNIFGNTVSTALFFYPKKYTATFQHGNNYLQKID